MVVFHAEAGAITDPELAAGVAATVEEAETTDLTVVTAIGHDLVATVSNEGVHAPDPDVGVPVSPSRWLEMDELLDSCCEHEQFRCEGRNLG